MPRGIGAGICLGFGVPGFMKAVHSSKRGVRAKGIRGLGLAAGLGSGRRLMMALPRQIIYRGLVDNRLRDIESLGPLNRLVVLKSEIKAIQEKLDHIELQLKESDETDEVTKN